jgi:hypothetical protein
MVPSFLRESQAIVFSSGGKTVLIFGREKNACRRRRVANEVGGGDRRPSVKKKTHHPQFETLMMLARSRGRALLSRRWDADRSDKCSSINNEHFKKRNTVVH